MKNAGGTGKMMTIPRKSAARPTSDGLQPRRDGLHVMGTVPSSTPEWASTRLRPGTIHAAPKFSPEIVTSLESEPGGEVGPQGRRVM